MSPNNTGFLDTLTTNNATTILTCFAHTVRQAEYLHHLPRSWLLEQLELLWTMWHQPPGTTATQIHGSMKDVSLRAFYRDSTQATRTRICPPNSKK